MNCLDRIRCSLSKHTSPLLPFDGDFPVHEFVHSADEEFRLGFGRFEVLAGRSGGFDQLLGVMHRGVAEHALVARRPGTISGSLESLPVPRARLRRELATQPAQFVSSTGSDADADRREVRFDPPGGSCSNFSPITTAIPSASAAIRTTVRASRCWVALAKPSPR